MSAGENNLQEILASIKRVIAEDRKLPEPASRRIAAEFAAESRKQLDENANGDVDGDDGSDQNRNRKESQNQSQSQNQNIPTILELTETVAEPDEQQIMAGQITGSPASGQGEEQDMSQDRFEDGQMDDDTQDQPLISADKGKEMRASLEALATLSRPGKPPQIVRLGETSLEELTRDLLRPMLAEWLDQNLPDLVEEMVAKEIARIRSKSE